MCPAVYGTPDIGRWGVVTPPYETATDVDVPLSRGGPHEARPMARRSVFSGGQSNRSAHRGHAGVFS